MIRLGPMISFLHRFRLCQIRIRRCADLFLSAYVFARRARNDPIAAIFGLKRRLPPPFLDPTLQVLSGLLRPATSLSPFRASLLPLAAAVEAVRGNVDDAHAWIEHSLVAVEQPRSLARLAQVALRSDRPDLADRALRNLDDNSSTVLEARGALLSRLGRLDEATDALRRVVATGEASSTICAHLSFLESRTALLRRTWSWTPTRVPATRSVSGRIVHLVTNSLPYTHAGYTVRTQSVGRCQQDAGLDPHFVTRAGFPELQGVLSAPRKQLVDGVPYHRIPVSAQTRLGDDDLARRTADGLTKLVGELQPACLHPATYHFNGQVALRLAQHLSLPVVYEVRGFLEETWLATHGPSAQDRSYYMWSKEAETYCMEHADRVVTLSDVMREEIRSRGIDPSKISVVPNAVDSEFLNTERISPNLRRRYGIREDVPIVGYVGSLVDYEGLPVLLRALHQLRVHGKQPHLFCVGDGPALAGLKRLTHSLDLDQVVTFTGRVSRSAVVDYYRLLDLFIVPRRDLRVCRLVTPIKPLEAMASGIPLVYSDLPPLSELAGEETGVSFPPDNIEALASTIHGLLSDDSARFHYGKGARRRVLDHYTWANNARLYYGLYKSLSIV